MILLIIFRLFTQTSFFSIVECASEHISVHSSFASRPWHRKFILKVIWKMFSFEAEVEIRVKGKDWKVSWQMDFESSTKIFYFSIKWAWNGERCRCWRAIKFVLHAVNPKIFILSCTQQTRVTFKVREFHANINFLWKTFTTFGNYLVDSSDKKK